MDPNDRKLVDVVVAYGDAFPVKDADGNEVLSGALRIPDGNIPAVWERNETPGSERTSTSFQSRTVSLNTHRYINLNGFYHVASGKLLQLQCR